MATIFNNVDRVAGDPLSSVLVTIVPVSYTHLDVYKRQMHDLLDLVM